jgi:hypothetical protein
MVKKLLISGCSYSMVYSDIQDELKDIFGVDEVINLSAIGTSPDRQIRAIIEWTAQNGKPDMIIMPVSHFNRFDLPIGKDMDPLHNLHVRMAWQNPWGLSGGNLSPLIDREILDTFCKTGSMVHQIEHPIHDYLFVKLITFQAYLQLNGIRHLIFDTGNYYEKLWMEYLRKDDENNSGYQPGMKKRDLVENCPGIYKFFSFCSNVWMYENCVEDKKNYESYLPIGDQSSRIFSYPLDDFQKSAVHHQKEQVIQLMKYLKQEGAVYG